MLGSRVLRQNGDIMAIQTPAADRLRPTEFDQVAGQQHLVSEKGILRRLLESGHLGSMIFFSALPAQGKPPVLPLSPRNPAWSCGG